MTFKKRDPALLAEAVYQNSYHVLRQPAAVRGLTFPNMQLKEKDPSIAGDFMANTKNFRHQYDRDHAIRQFLSDAGVLMVSLNENEDAIPSSIIPLPKGPALQLAFDQVLKHRRSTRLFTGDSIPLDWFARLCHAAQGVQTQMPISLQNGESVSLNLTAVGSAGALYPLELYCVPLNVSNLVPCIYRYRGKNHDLVQVADANVLNNLYESLGNVTQVTDLAQLSVIMLITAQSYKSMQKYGDRGLRFVLHEVGALSQTLHLAVSALGLGSVDYAGFYDDEVNAVLRLEGTYESIFHVILIGTI